MNKRIVLMAVMLLSLLASAASVMAQGAPGRNMSRPEAAPAMQVIEAAPSILKLGARLQGSAQHPNIAGWAEYEVERNGNREFEVDVWGAKAFAGKRVEVYVNGKLVGKMKINRAGRGDFDIETSDGDTVPHMKAGDTVEVRFRGATLAGNPLAVMPNSSANSIDTDDDMDDVDDMGDDDIDDDDIDDDDDDMDDDDPDDDHDDIDHDDWDDDDDND